MARLETRQIVAAAAAIVAAAVLLIAGILIGRFTKSDTVAAHDHTGRDFVFQVIGVKTPNQHGHTLNLFLHYRYNDGIADKDIPDFTKIRRTALDYLNTADLSKDPYWEVLNHQMCGQIKNSYPIKAISCTLQVVGSENPPPGDEPGYRSSVETIGDIAALALPGPVG